MATQPTNRLARATQVAPIVWLLLALACGGGGDSSGTNPQPTQPTQPGAPASLTLVTGDGQSANPRSTLPVKPSVLAKDATGRAVPGVSVQFTVDSGGGSLSASSVTTGADGIAIAGDWTLGGSAGAQVVTARSGALSPVKFRAMALGPTAQTLIEQGAVPANGGTLVFRKNGDPLDGLTLDVPAGSFDAATQWTLIADSTVVVTLPAGFTQVGPALIVGSGQGYANNKMTLTLPLPAVRGVTDADGIAPFFYDAATGMLEAVPLVERSATKVTLATRHFSRDVMALPSNSTEASSLREAGAVGFGAVTIVWVKTPKESLVGTFSTTFRPAVDNWEFENKGEYISPLGICEGMSVTALYYHYFIKSKGAPGLYHRYDESLVNLVDNVQGTRFAGSVQGDYEADVAKGITQEKQLQDEALTRGSKPEDFTSVWLLMTLKLTKNPVLMGLYSTVGAHAVVAYSATSTGAHTEVSFADPNFPKAGRVMTFESGQLTPLQMSAKVGAAGGVFNKAYALSVTSDVPLAKIDARWAEFTKQKAGADRYPTDYKLEYYDYLTDTWAPLPSTLKTTDEQLSIRHICKGCPTTTTGGAPNQHLVDIWDEEGRRTVAYNGQIQTESGTTKYIAVLSAYTVSHPRETGFVDAIPFTVIASPFDMLLPDVIPKLHESGTFVARGGPLETPGSKFTWQVDDGTAAVTGTSASFTHKFDRPGINIIKATLSDASGKAIAKTSIALTIRLPITIGPAPLIAVPASPTTITATVPGGIPAAYADSIEYAWSISGPEVNAELDTRTPTLNFTFPKLGAYTVSLSASMVNDYQNQSVSLGDFTTTFTVKPVFPVWKFTSFVLDVDQASPNPFTSNPLIGSTNHLTYELGVFGPIRDGTKQGGLLYIARDTTFPDRVGSAATLKKRGLYVVDGAAITNPLLATVLAMPGEGSTFTTLGDPTAIRGSWILTPPSGTARVADTPLLNEGYTETGTITAGSISGTYWRFQTSTPTQNNGTLWFPFETRQANVTFSGNTATGTITIIGRNFNHAGGSNLPKPEVTRWTVRATFTAVRVQ